MAIGIGIGGAFGPILFDDAAIGAAVAAVTKRNDRLRSTSLASDKEATISNSYTNGRHRDGSRPHRPGSLNRPADILMPCHMNSAASSRPRP